MQKGPTFLVLIPCITALAACAPASPSTSLTASLTPLRLTGSVAPAPMRQLGINPLPKFAFKLGAGVVGDEPSVFFGVEATLPKVPIIPTLRIDFDAWGSNLGFDGRHRGNALNAMFIQDIGPVYFGFGGGLAYDRRPGESYSGIGGKALVGARLPIVNLRLEGNLWVTGNGTAAAVMLGLRF